MTKITDRKNLAAVKQAMADKYATLAKAAKSQVKQREFSQHAQKYRLQASKLSSM